MFEGQYDDALRAAAAPTLERIRRHGAQATGRLPWLFTYLEEHLFDPTLHSGKAWKKAGIRDHGLVAPFKALTGMSLKPYIDRNRVDVARRLVVDTEILIETIGLLVGYSSHTAFLRAFKKEAKGRLPSDLRQDLAARTTSRSLELPSSLEGLSPAAARRMMKKFFARYPFLLRELLARGQGDKAEIIIDGGRYESYTAVGMWQEIRRLPPAEQEREVRRLRFSSTAFFDLLRERSRTEGRRDRQLGIHIAELALASLDDRDDHYGERIHDLRALAWAWLGNAHVLALDFTAADSAFEEAGREWATPRDQQDQLVLARVCNLEGTLRMFQRRYEPALKLVDRSRDLSRLGGDRKGEARALIQRASILGYDGQLEEAIRSLQTAEKILADHDDPFLAYAAATNLANAYLRKGDNHLALEHLGKAKKLCVKIDHPSGRCEVQAVEGFIRHGLGELQEAEELCLRARAGFVAASEAYSVALVDLELALLYTNQDAWDKVVAFSSEAVPLLEGLRLYEETLAAVALLARAIETEQVPPQVLKTVRESLEQDPLTRLSQPARTDKPAGPLFFSSP